MVVQLSKELEEIRVTGGESLMILASINYLIGSKKLMNPNAKNMRLAINSNLMAKEGLLNKFIDATQHIDHFMYIQVVKQKVHKQNILEMD